MAPGYVTLDGVNYDEIWYGVMLPAIDMYKVAKIPILDRLSMPWDLTLFNYIPQGRMGFQSLSKSQKPDMRKLPDEAWLFPRYEKWGIGIGTDRDSLAMGTARQFTAAINRVYAEDPEEITRRMIRQIMMNPGTLNSGFGLYNGAFAVEEKITAPPSFGENVFASTHTHYVTTQGLVPGAGANITFPVVSALKTHVQHHGVSGPLVGFINRLGAERFENLLNVTNAITRSPISDAIAMEGFTDSFTLLGVDWYVTETMPDNYGLLIQTSGDDFGQPMIFFEPPTLRGLHLYPGTDALHPLIECYFERWGGWKIWQRGAGIAFQVSANTTYTNPTFIVTSP